MKQTRSLFVLGMLLVGSALGQASNAGGVPERVSKLEQQVVDLLVALKEVNLQFQNTQLQLQNTQLQLQASQAEVQQLRRSIPDFKNPAGWTSKHSGASGNPNISVGSLNDRFCMLSRVQGTLTAQSHMVGLFQESGVWKFKLVQGAGGEVGVFGEVICIPYLK